VWCTGFGSVSDMKWNGVSTELFEANGRNARFDAVGDVYGSEAIAEGCLPMYVLRWLLRRLQSRLTQLDAAEQTGQVGGRERACLTGGRTACWLSLRSQSVLPKLDHAGLTEGLLACVLSWSSQSVLAKLEAAGSLLAEHEAGDADWFNLRLLRRASSTFGHRSGLSEPAT